MFKLAVGIFLEEPQAITVWESANATFTCILSNSSFSIHWEVNGSDAGFREFRERGVTVSPTNSTSSELHIIGQKGNNNTHVQCIAVLFHNYRIIKSVSSNVALLRVIGKCP